MIMCMNYLETYSRWIKLFKILNFDICNSTGNDKSFIRLESVLCFVIFTLVLCSNAAIADTRIVGGKFAMEGAWPSTVSLINKSTAESIDRGEAAFIDGNDIPTEQANYWAHSCGGSLILSNWVLTAAHCMVDGETGEIYSNDYYLVLTGISDLFESGLRTAVKRIVVHPDYDPLSDAPYNADIALLELSQPVYQSTQKLFTEYPSAGITTTATGWGFTMEGGSRSRYLRQVDLPTISNYECRRSIREHVEHVSPDNLNSSQIVAYADSILTDNMFCAGDGQGERDACQADSGGPLMAVADGEYAQLGIVSWGYGCARVATYGVYTKVSNYFSWIRSIVNPESAAPINPTQNGENTSSEESSSSGSGGGSTSLYSLIILVLAGLLRSSLLVYRHRIGFF